MSLENLFPCDQSEIYATKKISFIIDEFVQTEENYVNNLKKGLQNYGGLQKYDRLPESLKGEDKQKLLLGNVAEILELHEKQILPLMLRNQRDLKSMFDEMAQQIDVSRGSEIALIFSETNPFSFCLLGSLLFSQIDDKSF